MGKIEHLQPHFKTSLAKAFKNAGSPSEAHINLAFSLSPEGLPARVLAGIIPAFNLAQALQEQLGVPTSVRIFAPLNLAVACNGFPETQDQFRSIGLNSINQGTRLVDALQQTHFPAVSWRVTTDQPWTDKAAQVLGKIWDRSQELDEEQFNQAKNALSQSGKSNTHLYIPHHLFGWQDCFDPAFFPEDDKPKPGELIVNCMSQSERNFQTFRKRLAWDLQVTEPGLLTEVSPIDVMTERCPGPHYIRARDETDIEPSLDELVAQGFIQTVRTVNELTKRNPKFGTAQNDLMSVFDFFHQRWITNPSLPTLDEFVAKF